MDFDHIEAARLLIEFAREIQYNDNRFPPKEINEAAQKLEDYLEGN